MSTIRDNIVRMFNGVNESCRIWPCLIGPTGSGKTSTIFSIAKELNMDVTVLLPGTMLPEDILGLPRVIDNNTVWALPDWAKDCTNKPKIIFIDELDKAREEVHAAILTLLSGLQIRNFKLHPECKIVCAMQPVDAASFVSSETGKAITARLAFFPVDDPSEYIARKHNLKREIISSIICYNKKDVEVPRLDKPSGRQIEAVINYIKDELNNANHEEINSIKDLKEFVIRNVGDIGTAILGATNFERVLDGMLDNIRPTFLNPKALRNTLVRNPELLKQLDTQRFASVAPLLVVGDKSKAENGCEALNAFCHQLIESVRRGVDDFRAMVDSIHGYIEANYKDGDEVNVFTNAEEKEVVLAMNVAAIASAAVEIKRAKDEGKYKVEYPKDIPVRMKKTVEYTKNECPRIAELCDYVLNMPEFKELVAE